MVDGDRDGLVHERQERPASYRWGRTEQLVLAFALLLALFMVVMLIKGP